MRERTAEPARSSADPEQYAYVATLLQVIGAYESDLRASGTIVTHNPLPTLPVEATQLGQVFQNLLSNAIKYSNAEETPRIHFGIFGFFKRLHGAQVLGTTFLFTLPDAGTH